MKTRAYAMKIDITTANGLTELEQTIQCRLSGLIRAFRLDVAQEGLVLRGHSLTYYAKQLAQHAVMQATDLPIWANDIEVC